MRLNLLAMATLVAAQIPEKENYYVTDPPIKADDLKESVKIEASNSFADCTCDITAGSCDEFCCCDKDCSPQVISQWKLESDKFCKNEQDDLITETFSECYKAKNTKTIDDIKGGFSLFKKVPITLLCPFTQGSVSSSNDFIEPIAKPEDIDKFIEESADYELKSYATKTKSALKDYHDKTEGYQVYEAVKGFLDGGSGGAIHKPENRINVQVPGLFGECSDLHFLNFLEPLKTQSCSFHRQKLTQEFCEKTLSIDHILNAVISKDSQKISDAANGVKIVPKVVAKYGFSTADYFSLDAEPGSNKATDDDLATLKAVPKLDGNTCDNFALEYHLQIGFSQKLNEGVPYFVIDSAELILVLGKESANDDEQVTITRKTSVSFYETKPSIENEDGSVQTFDSEPHPNSGNPGYEQNSIIKIGKINSLDPDVKKQDAILESKSGFYLRGAANTGQCWYVKTRVDDPNAKTSAFDNIEGEDKISYLVADSLDEKHYFEDPLLTFDDSILYGCHLDMNYAELQEFCEEKMDRFKYLALFQNIFSIDKIAKFGNSSIYNQNDWITVEKDESMFKSVDFTQNSFDKGNCRMYSMELDIYYKKIGSTFSPQNVIIKAKLQLKQNSNILWKFTRPDPKVRQRFQIGLSINYYPIEQSQTLFVPQSPQFFSSLNRNVLYPFIVYGNKEQGTQTLQE